MHIKMCGVHSFMCMKGLDINLAVQPLCVYNGFHFNPEPTLRRKNLLDDHMTIETLWRKRKAAAPPLYPPFLPLFRGCAAHENIIMCQ